MPYGRVLHCAPAAALTPAFRRRLGLPPCVPAVLSVRSTGISTSRPSATRLRLALGPDLPRADQLYSGNLGYSARGIPAPVSLLIPAFSLQWRPQRLTVLLRPPFNAPLPIMYIMIPGLRQRV